MSFLSTPLSIIAIFPNRAIGDINVQVILNENSTDTLTITKQPVQMGASISDHAFKEPVTLSMSVLFKDNPTKSLSDLYADLIALQAKAQVFNVVTPKRLYANMLISSIAQTTDKNTENALSLNLSFQEVIIVPVSAVTVSRKSQARPAATGKTESAGKKSLAVKTMNAIKGVFLP